MNYYKRHIGDYIRDTSHLSLLEHGVYTRLLDVYYVRELPIPDEEAARLVGARSKDEKAALQRVLREFFTLCDAKCWNHKRCDEEIAQLTIKAQKNREVGKLGGRPSTKSETKEVQRNNHDGFKNNHNGFETITIREPSDNPFPDSTTPIASSRRRATRLPDDFELSESRKAIAEREGLNPDRTFTKFCDYWRSAAKNNTKLDWDATWRTWCMNDSDRNKPKAKPESQWVL